MKVKLNDPKTEEGTSETISICYVHSYVLQIALYLPCHAWCCPAISFSSLNECVGLWGFLRRLWRTSRCPALASALQRMCLVCVIDITTTSCFGGAVTSFILTLEDFSEMPRNSAPSRGSDHAVVLQAWLFCNLKFEVQL